MEKKFRTREISVTWLYNVEEAAAVIGGSTRTIRNWIKAGYLVLLSNRKPYEIVGADLKACVLERRVARKSVLGATDFYCFRCKCARGPKNAGVVKARNKGPSWRMVGACESCGCKMNRSIKFADLPLWETVFRIKTDEPQSTT